MESSVNELPPLDLSNMKPVGWYGGWSNPNGTYTFVWHVDGECVFAVTELYPELND